MKHPYLSFRLHDEFVDGFADLPVQWGFPIGGGNSLAELTFITKYSRLKEDGTKERWHEVCRRVIEGMFSIQKDHCLHHRIAWNSVKARKAAEDAYTRMFNFLWTPPGRGMEFMGTEIVHSESNSAPLMNCFLGSERLITSRGFKTFESVNGTTVKLLSEGGKWLDAPISQFGEQEIWEIKLSRNGIHKSIFTTENHRWFVRDRRRVGTPNNRFVEVLTKDLQTYHEIQEVLGAGVKQTSPSPFGIAHGFVFGDGHAVPGERNANSVRLFGAKDRALMDYFKNCPSTSGIEHGGWIEFRALPNHFKFAPDYSENKSYLYGWLAGYFAADGSVGVSTGISSTKRENLEIVKEVCSLIGIATFSITEIDRVSNLTNQPSRLYKINFDNSCLTEDFFILDEHKRRFLEKTSYKSRPKWSILGVENTQRVEKVYCATVEGYGKFVLEDNLLTGNCSFLGTDRLSLKNPVSPFVLLMEQSMWGVGCIASGSLISTSEGLVPIENLDGRPFVALVGDQKYEAPFGSWKTGSKSIVNLVTREGYEVRLTADHRVLIANHGEVNEWKEAKDLVMDDCVVLSASELADNGNGSFEEGYLCGLVWGDGWLNPRPVVAIYDKDEGSDGIARAAMDCKRSIIDGKTRLTDTWMRKSGRMETNVGGWIREWFPSDKSLTRVVLGSRAFQRGFLMGAFDADGTVCIASGSRRSVRLTQSRRDDLLKIQIMLLSFGIKSYISTKRSESTPTTINGVQTISNPCWDLVISKSGIAKFASEIGFFHTEKAQRLESLNGATFRKQRMLARVLSVEPCGVEETWDIMVPDVESFVANGITVHNCGFSTNGEGKLTIHAPKSDVKTVVVEDSREGWAASVGELLRSYFVPGQSEVAFDYSLIRPEGTPLKRFGKTASGPAPLKKLHASLREQFDGRDGQSVTSTDIVDINNKIGKAVVAGSARRSAELALGAHDDKAFLDLKNWDINPVRMGADGWGYLSNNSVAVEVGDNLDHLVEKIALNGEPGIVWLDLARKYGRMGDKPNNKDYRVSGVNPCIVGDTLVAVADGRGSVPMIQLVNEGVSVPVYCVDNDGKIAIRMMREPRLTGASRQTVKVTLDDGSIAAVTPNHKFILRDGSEKRADELKSGDALLLLTRYEVADKWHLALREQVQEAEHELIANFDGGANHPVLLDGHIEKICENCSADFLTEASTVAYCSGGCSRAGSLKLGNLRKAGLREASPKIATSHRVVCVEVGALEDVYNGTVDEFHNFFIGGWESLTVNGKTKQHFVANRQCGEQTLEDHELCTLVELYPTRHDSLEDFLQTVKIAYLYGKSVTLLPTPWPECNEVMQRNRRIGLSMTGVAQFADNRGSNVLRQWCDAAYEVTCLRDVKYSEWLGVRESIKKTTVKPSGTVSLVAGVWPGVHWPVASGKYLRRQRFRATDPMVEVFADAGYGIEPDVMDPDFTVVVTFPTLGPEGRSQREVTLWEKMALAALMGKSWSDNAVSATFTFAPHEVDQIGYAIKAYEGQLKTMSFLPMGDEGENAYAQMPYEVIPESEFDELYARVKPINWSKVYSNGVEADGDRYCDGDSCVI